MQTFMPYPSFIHSLETLDNKRLGKQRVEALQILNTLTGQSSGWATHPAVRMWAGHELALCEYGLTACLMWRNRGFSNALTLPKLKAHRAALQEAGASRVRPAWMCDYELHKSHRFKLVWKNPAHYAPQFLDVRPLPDTEPEYYWPVLF